MRRRYLGLDLAATPRDLSGGVALEVGPSGAAQVVSAAVLRTHEDTLRWVTQERGRSTCIVALNAPVILENTNGARPCEALLAEHFTRFRVDVSTHNISSASHARTMARALGRMGFDPDPTTDGNRLIETHTQAAEIMLFNTDRPVHLKAGPIGSRKDAAARLRELIVQNLANYPPPLARSAALDSLILPPLAALNGTRLGELEAMLEALIVGYVAAWLGEAGPDACACLGDTQSGYVLLPDPSRLPEA